MKPNYKTAVAVLAGAARGDRRPAGAVGADAVERPREDARGRRLAGAAHPGEDEGMGDAACGDRVRQRAHHRFLPDQLREGGRAVFAGEDAVGDRWFCHERAVSPGGRRWEAGRTTQAETRYGCFLPDLTGLARDLSAANLPLHYIRFDRRGGKEERNR